MMLNLFNKKKEEPTIVKFKKIKRNAMLPVRNYETDAGMDFTTIYNSIVPPGRIRIIGTGLACELEKGYEMQIRPRSGLATKGLTILNSPGTVDCDYRGEIKIIFYNAGEKPIDLKKGSKIAQGVICKLPIVQVKEVDELSETERGEKGFGSSDKNIIEYWKGE